MIKVNNLLKIFNKNKSNEVRAVNDVSVEFPEKGLVAIYGASGSGKTTFMNALGGLDKFDGGEIIMNGNVYKSSVDDKYRIENIGYIFQNYLLDERLDVYQNVAQGLRTVGVRDEEVIFDRVMTALDNVGMRDYYKRNVTTLSGGQQQRVAIARAMVKGARIILADEPTGNLDELNTRTVMELLKALSTNCLVIVVTHEGDLIEKYADSVIEIKDGRIENLSEGGKISHGASDKTRVFLGDKKKNRLTVDNVNIDYYGEALPVNIVLVNEGGKIYLKTTDENVRLIDEKSEIKFEDDSVIFEILMATVKEAIGGNALAPAIDFDMEGAPEIPATPLERTNIRQPKINFDPLFNPFRDLDSSGMHAQPREEGRRNGYDLTGEGKLLFEEGHETERREIMQIQGRYLLTSAKSGVILIDAMRAKERILYERYLNALRGARPAIQENLFPQTVELDSASFAIFTQVQEKIRELGFDIRPFGKNCVIVSGIPAAFANEQIDVAESVETIIAGFETHDTQERSLADYRERIALGMVKNIKSNKKSMTHDEAVSIVESIFACKESSYSPSGLPIMKTITVEELSAMLKN